jgi:hypothetical protein
VTVFDWLCAAAVTLVVLYLAVATLSTAAVFSGSAKAEDEADADRSEP